MMEWLGASKILADDDSSSVLLVSGALIVIVLFGAMGVFWMRRRLRDDDSVSGDGGGFTLSDLRQMHQEGQLTTEEFERARLMAVAAAQRQAERQMPSKNPPTSGDVSNGPTDR